MSAQKKDKRNDADMYKKMYCILFKSIENVYDICTDSRCVKILEQAQIDAEDIFIKYYE